MRNFKEDSGISLKVASNTKTKRLGKLPQTYEELRQAVEAQINEERAYFSHPEFAGKKDYTIRYQDGDQEVINVSDDEDLSTAYEVAKKELGGVLKFKVDFKVPLQQLIERGPLQAGPKLAFSNTMVVSEAQSSRQPQVESASQPQPPVLPTTAEKQSTRPPLSAEAKAEKA